MSFALFIILNFLVSSSFNSWYSLLLMILPLPCACLFLIKVFCIFEFTFFFYCQQDLNCCIYLYICHFLSVYLCMNSVHSLLCIIHNYRWLLSFIIVPYHALSLNLFFFIIHLFIYSSIYLSSVHLLSLFTCLHPTYLLICLFLC